MVRDASKQADRMFFIEGLRGLAALYVVLGHFCSMADPRMAQGQTSHAPLWLQWVMKPFAFGHLAVAAFIVISGFCLQMSVMGGLGGTIKNLKTFYIRRARRILPPYYAALLLSLGIAAWVTTPLAKSYGMPFSQYVPIDGPTVLSHLFLYHNWNAEWMYKINGVLWSIGIEAQLYLLFPLVLLSLRKAGRLTTVLAFAASVAILLAAAPASVKFKPWYLALFALGMAGAHIAYRPPSRKTFKTEAFVVAGLGFISTIALSAFNAYIPWRDAANGIGVVSLMYACSLQPNCRPNKILSLKPMVALGTISYSLYLMHHPIQQILFAYRPVWVDGEVATFTYMLVVGIPVILFTCLGFWLAFERPLQMRLWASSKMRQRVPIRAALTPLYSSEESLPARTIAEEPSEAPAWAREAAQDPEPTPVKV